jgi:hypothetical protein
VGAWAAAGLFLVAAACAGPGRIAPSQLRHRVAGCYQLREGPWRTDTALLRFFDVSWVPARLQLDTARLVSPDSLHPDSLPLFVARTDESASRRWSPFTYWQQLHSSSDTIHVGPRVAFAGVFLRVVPRGERLEGTISTFTDMVPRNGVSTARAPIVLDRGPCPAATVTSSDSTLRRVLSAFAEGDPIRVALLRSRWAGTFMGMRGDTLFFGTVGQPPMGLLLNAVDTVWSRGSMLQRWRRVYP